MTLGELRLKIVDYKLGSINATEMDAALESYTKSLQVENPKRPQPIYEEDEDEMLMEWECDMCGGLNGKHNGYDCPNDDSPYALLLRRGYD